ncbi:MAG: flagellar hook-basal body complex protein FliE, partial [Pseudomonadota bacterium]|nr:flagellar hook-basal body complex protein FliE [Pseudomonadota bacterium]
MSVGGIGATQGASGGIDRVMALRAQILERNQALARANSTAGAPAPTPDINGAKPTSFTSAMEDALKNV